MMITKLLDLLERKKEERNIYNGGKVVSLGRFSQQVWKHWVLDTLSSLLCLVAEIAQTLPHKTRISIPHEKEKGKNIKYTLVWWWRMGRRRE